MLRLSFSVVGDREGELEEPKPFDMRVDCWREIEANLYVVSSICIEDTQNNLKGTKPLFVK